MRAYRWCSIWHPIPLPPRNRLLVARRGGKQKLEPCLFGFAWRRARLCFIAIRARALDALVLEEDVARSLGANLSVMRLRLALGLALGVGSVVAVTGVIGFVGLVAPHLVRPFTGTCPRARLSPPDFWAR